MGGLILGVITLYKQDFLLLLFIMDGKEIIINEYSVTLALTMYPYYILSGKFLACFTLASTTII